MPPAVGYEKEGVQLSVQKKHDQGGVQSWHGKENEKGGDRRHPDEQWQPVELHVRGAQDSYGDDEVDGSHDRPGP